MREGDSVRGCKGKNGGERREKIREREGESMRKEKK